MNITHTPLADLKIIKPTSFADERGFFYESYQQQKYRVHTIPAFVQDNHSRSIKNVLRGLHYQLPYSQGKLVGVTHGMIFDVAVDIRKSSTTFGKWFGIILSDENHLQLYIPPGFAHGFCVLSDRADFYYKCSEFYAPTHEKGIRWDDATINIEWPTKTPILSAKDKTLPCLNEVEDAALFP